MKFNENPCGENTTKTMMYQIDMMKERKMLQIIIKTKEKVQGDNNPHATSIH